MNQNTTNLKNVTIIIPAHNRPERLYRLLHYYKPYNIPIIVSDSSHLYCPFAIDQFENVVYRHFPDTHFFVKIKEIIPLIQTPYIVYVAEDDFTTPEGISQCVQFLESHPDYTSAQGHYLTFEPNRKRVKFTPRYIRNLNSQITGETARERLVSKGSLYGSLLYAVVRTEAFKKTYEVCFDPANKILFNNLFLAEALFNYSMLIQGKYATIPVFFSAREYIYHSATATTVSLKTIHNAPAYATEYNNFIQAVSLLLNQQEKSENTEIQNTKDFDFIFELDKLPSLSIKQKITNYFLLKNNPISRFINYRYHKKGEKTCKGIDSIPIATVSIKNKEQIPAPLRPICDAIRLTKKQFS